MPAVPLGSKYSAADIADGDALSVPGGVSYIVVGAAGTSTGTSSVVSSMSGGQTLTIEGSANSIKFNSTALASITQDAIQLGASTRTVSVGDRLVLERVSGLDSSGNAISWWREVQFNDYTT